VGSGDAHAAYRWGVCYVIEGSQLGGLVLYRRLADRLTPHPLNYLNPHEDPAAIGRRWQQFIRTIGSAVTRDDDVAQACQGACDAFDDILAWRDRLPAATPAEISR
jgi:heme oxygenase